MKNSQIATSLTIVFLILTKNVAQIGSYAASNVATFENNILGSSNNNNINNDETHRLTKRMDLESCLGQFDVHKNTIIRTGESQAIGGKYLQGIELETMEECQRLCCETDSCDVYIFESKKDGYCYLFECGTPENFHCKFTRHANYTSAVLTPILRPVNEVTTPRPASSQQALSGHSAHGSTTNISQQELELSNLKVKSDIKEKSNDIMPPSNAIKNSSNKKSLTSLINMDTSLTTKVNISVQCGRFQFACHSGECIAVYNACDGIPQCEDGSDEGPECSGANNNNNNLNSKPTQDFTVSNKIVESAAMPQYSKTLSQQTPQQQLQSMQQQSHGQVLNAIGLISNREDPNVWETRKIVAGSVNPHMRSGNEGNPDSSQIVAQQQLQQQQQQQQQSDSFTSYVNNRGQNGNSIYTAGSSTLEQSGLYIPHVAQEMPANVVYTPQQQQQQQQHIMLPLPPPPPPAPINSNWQQQAIIKQQQQQLASQTINGQQQLTLPEVSGSYVEQNKAIQQQQQQQQVTKTLQQQQLQSAQNLVPSLNQQQQQQVQQPSQTQTFQAAGSAAVKTSEDSNEYEDSEEKSTEPPKKHKHKKVKSKSKDVQKNNQENLDNTKAPQPSIKTIKTAISPVHEQYEIIHQNMALEFRDHDGQSERPGGAVLSLTLGLLITAALAILIGCRMRTVGKRVRRMGGKAPYSHEADFLVNGMYL